jgi:hypothetical protein
MSAAASDGLAGLISRRRPSLSDMVLEFMVRFS